MELKEILAISGQPGLYKYVAQSSRGVIVESLSDGKRMKKRKRETEDKLLDTAQAAKMLNVSKRTMQRMRTDHRIEYVVVRGSCR